MNDLFWKAKLVAWLHDPPAKGFLLGRVGHEEPVLDLFEKLFGKREFPKDVEPFIRKGDHWASAADRPQAPRIPHSEFAASTFSRKPVFTHPLDGRQYQLQSLVDTDTGELSVDGIEHLRGIILSTAKEDQSIDLRKAFLALWRFGPENAKSQLGNLWSLLPADTRVPDHSIWEHLHVTSAFAGCFAREDEPALLSVSLGPVQSFIAQARSTSDLWAGSHFLSQMSWEAIKVIVEAYGPDSILLPSLWSVPIVDVWLKSEGINFPDEEQRAWFASESDANPLFTAALPNVFTALVPASEAAATATTIETRVRAWVREKADLALGRILRAAGLPESETTHAHGQIERQLEGFPEVHWSVVPFSVVDRTADGRKAVADQNTLARLLGSFGNTAGFLGSDLQKLLNREISLDGQTFYQPNPGVFYPALFELLTANRDAAKSVRPFTQTLEEGFRCTLCGEREWLSLEREHLSVPRGDRGEGTGKAQTLWTRAASGARAWTRKGDHLCGLCTLKRVWPALFRDEMAKILPNLEDVRRYVVSTHTMALATSLDKLLGRWNFLQAASGDEEQKRIQAGEKLLSEIARRDAPSVALPRNLVERLRHEANGNEKLKDLIRRAPGLLDLLAEEQDETGERSEKAALLLETAVGQKLEDYYALLLLDGDRMGAFVSGDRDVLPHYRDLWHPEFLSVLKERIPKGSDLDAFISSPRALSPSLHAAISHSLNSFALHGAPFVVERLYKGKVIYAGGDDLMAMCAVDEILEILLMVRAVYSGTSPAGDSAELRTRCGVDKAEHRGFRVDNAHMTLQGTLHRMMGASASASAGVVVAHHKAPLGSVLRELRAAEKRAKQQGGRNAFSIHVLKRSGGASRFTARFWRPKADSGNPLSSTPPALLMRMSDLLRDHLSRRAAYHILAWIDGIPERYPKEGNPLLEADALEEMISLNLRHQMLRQMDARTRKDEAEKQEATAEITSLCRDLAAASIDPELAGRNVERPEAGIEPREWIREAVTVAEFLARESRRAGER